MFVIETNARQVFADIQRVFDDMPKVVQRRQGGLRRIMVEGVDQHFQDLGEGGAVKSLHGPTIQWQPLSENTVNIRRSVIQQGRAAPNVGPATPILQLTGAMRQAAMGGVVFTSVNDQTGTISFTPAGEQEKFSDHDEGAEGRFGPMSARPVLFWDEDMAQRVVESISAHFDTVSHQRGFT